MRNPASAQKKVTAIHADPCTVDAKHYQVEFEDERIRVLRIKYGPHEKSAMHGHPDSFAVFLTDLHARFTYPDGETEEIRGKAGETMYSERYEHLPENLSSKPMELVLVEFKKR